MPRIKKKKNYRPLGSVFIIIFIWYMLVGKTILPIGVGSNYKTNKEQKALPTAYLPCTEANVARILAWTLIDNAEQVLKSDKDIWYSKYYKALSSKLNFTLLKQDHAFQPVTYMQVASILENVLGEGYGIYVQAAEEKLQQPIMLSDFMNIYINALKQTGKGVGIEYIECVVLATPENNTSLNAWEVATNQGVYSFEGLILDPFKGTTIKAFVKGKQLLAISERIEGESYINQCYIQKVTPDSATFQVGNFTLTYPNEALSNKQEGQIGLITLKDNRITGFEEETSKVTDTLLAVTPEYVWLKEGGRLAYDEVKIYDTRKTPTYKRLAQLPCGTEVAYVKKDKKLESLKIVESNKQDRIRVLLSGNKLGEYKQDAVKLVSDKEYTISYNGKDTILPQGEIWDAKKFSWKEKEDVVYLKPKTDSLIKVLSMKRQDSFPKYKGVIEVHRQSDGFYLINELQMEDYIAAVIPSEMPTSYGIEALKVQAVAARSYASVAQNSTKYVSYGAQIDDSTDSQVYNNVPANDLSYQAAKQTKGKLLLYNNQIISSKFYATSCGYGANFGEVWASGATFPTNTPVYLASKMHCEEEKEKDMSKEEAIKKFLQLDPEEVDAFDNTSPWFRWKVDLKRDELEKLVNSAIGKISRTYSYLVKVQTKEENWVTKPIDNVGKIKDIYVVKRGKGGNIMELVVKGDKATVKVATEYLIRSLFSTNDKQMLNVTRADGTEIKGMSMLPSAFFTIDKERKENGTLVSITLDGGGFGHGVGMSQDGVKGMAKRGYSYTEILEHYYPNVSIKEQK